MISTSFCRGFLKELRKCRLQPYHVEDMRYILSLPSVRAIAGGGGLSECCEVVDASVNVPVDPLELAHVCKQDFLEAVRTSSNHKKDSREQPAQQLAVAFWLLRRLKAIQNRSIASAAARGVARTFCEKTTRDAFPAHALFLRSGTAVNCSNEELEAAGNSGAEAFKTFCRKNVPMSLNTSVENVRASVDLSLYEPTFIPSATATEDDGLPFKETRARFKLTVSLTTDAAESIVTVVNTHFYVACPSEGTLLEHSSLMDPSDLAKIHHSEQKTDPRAKPGGFAQSGGKTTTASVNPRSFGSGKTLASMHNDTHVYFISLPKGCSWGLLKGILYVKCHSAKDRTSLTEAPIVALPFGVLRMTEDE